MSHPSKVKGSSYERELVEQAKAAGLEAKRAWGSNGAAMGEHPEVDLVVGEARIQAKRRKSLPSYLQVPPSCTAVCFRQDRGETLVLVRWRSYLKFLQAESEKGKNDQTH